MTELSKNTQVPQCDKTDVSGSLQLKLTAYECYKKRIDDKLSDDDFKKLLVDNGIIIKKEPCANCKENNVVCKCIKNICYKCGYSVGNITFSVCDECWDS